MKRTGFIRRKPAGERSRYADRDRDTDRMLWVKTRPCSVVAHPRAWMRETMCGGPIEADHAGRRGLGQKAGDDTCIPLCSQHHRERTDHHGAFFLGTKAQLREWLDFVVLATQTAWIVATHPRPAS